MIKLGVDILVMESTTSSTIHQQAIWQPIVFFPPFLLHTQFQFLMLMLMLIRMKAEDVDISRTLTPVDHVLLSLRSDHANTNSSRVENRENTESFVVYETGISSMDISQLVVDELKSVGATWALAASAANAPMSTTPLKAVIRTTTATSTTTTTATPTTTTTTAAMLLRSRSLPLLSHCYMFAPACHCKTNDQLECANFRRLEELDFRAGSSGPYGRNARRFVFMRIDLSETVRASKHFEPQHAQSPPPHQRTRSGSSLAPSPAAVAVLDDRLKLDGLSFDASRFHLTLDNLHGIELTYNPFVRRPAKLVQFSDTEKSFVSDLTESDDSVSRETLSAVGQESSSSSSVDSEGHQSHQPKRMDSLSINNGTLHFFFRGNKFDWICDLVLNELRETPLFASFRTVFLGYFGRVSYPQRTCPVIFKNARLDALYLSNLTSSNRPRFIQLPYASSPSGNTARLSGNKPRSALSTLNATVRQLYVQASNLSVLDGCLVDRLVFAGVRKLSVEFCHLDRIETALFAHLPHLRRLNLWLFNLGAFLRASDNRWMRHLNERAAHRTRSSSKQKQRQINQKYVSSTSAVSSSASSDQFVVELSDESSEPYRYPDKDLCNFQHLPHKRGVFVLVRATQPLNCTCTLLWLVRNWREASIVTLDTLAIHQCFAGNRTDEMLRRCNFEQRLAKCLGRSLDTAGGSERNSLSDVDQHLATAASVLTASMTKAFYLMPLCFMFVLAMYL